jgi:hypothetical protein
MKNLFLTLVGLLLYSLFNIAHAAPEGYCDSQARISRYFWQESTSLGENLITTGNDGGYLYTQTPEIMLTEGESTISLNPGYRAYAYPLYWRGWLDLNGDMQFTPDEELFKGTARGPLTLPVTLPHNPGMAQGILRVSMKYGSYPQPCEIYQFGETEDFVISFQQAEIQHDNTQDQYHVSVDHDFTIRRSGAIGDTIKWVIELDGNIALRRNAASDLQYTYNRNLNGSHIRVWLEKFVDGDNQRVSNIAEYTPGTSDLYQLTLETGFEISRSGVIGDNLTWVIEENGEIVLERLATNELSYVYFNNTDNSKYQVWLEQFINGQYEIVSNTVEYEVGQTMFEISVDQLNQLRRNGQPGDDLSWVIEENGEVVSVSDACCDMSFKYTNQIPGAQYRAWLEMNIEGEFQTVSNIVEYSEPEFHDYSLSLGADYQITRSGELGENLAWVIIKDGKVVLQRNAANELSYTYYRNTDGSNFKVYLHKFIDGYYQRVSNIVEYRIDKDQNPEQTQYELVVDQSYQLSRNGQLGDRVMWVVEEDGKIVLQRNASNETTYTYFNHKPGSTYRAWLQQYIDGTYQTVSNEVTYSIPEETNEYTLTLGEGYSITRSGSLGDNVNWIIIRNGELALQRNAANELSYTYYRNTVGSTIEVYLEKFIDGAYQQVSNAIRYTVQ